MKRKASSTKYELKVNVSPPRPNLNHQLLLQRDDSPKRSDSGSGSGSGSSSPSSSSSLSSSSSSDMSIEGSCVSSEAEETTTVNSPPPMVLVGCPRCLMYVMLSESNPKCPRCQSTVLLDFLKDENPNKKSD